MDFRFYNGRIPLHTNQTILTMNPNRVKLIEFNAGVSSVTRVEIIPHVSKEGMDIICSERTASSEVNACV